jgi:hypothetical protein
MANVHQLIVKHLCSYEDEDAQELYDCALFRNVCTASYHSHVHRYGVLRWWYPRRHNARTKSQRIR